MKINQAISSTLLVAVTEAIQDGTVSKYGTYKFSDGWEKSTLQAVGDDFTKSLIKALDGSNLENFLRESLKVVEIESKVTMPKDGGKLSALECFSDPLKVARGVVKQLEKLPIQYRMLIKVFQELSDRINRKDIEIRLSDRLNLLSGSMIPDSFMLNHEDDELNAHFRGVNFKSQAPFTTSETGLYIEYRATGYLSLRRMSKTVGEFYDEVRAFYGGCIAYGIMGTFSFSSEQISPILIANSLIDGNESFAFVDRAEEDVAKCANLATSNDTDEKIERGDDLEKIMAPVLSIFRSENNAKLKTACAWALRAHLSARGLDKILESAITIEVLMGDRDTSDRIGLSKLIANRCAYALGKSVAERDDIINFFAQFYRVRSEVVHSGRTSLHAEERKIVDEGLSLATRILQHEISLAT